ncbi:hypothetical protein ACFV4F_32105 [Kitasatospora sp. NPDC059722]|uniref:hypothetical protein n=1 Tax=Kitasatospora sp. NPDC059722 TaxID=3346925 RepID=UPI0036CDDCF5
MRLEMLTVPPCSTGPVLQERLAMILDDLLASSCCSRIRPATWGSTRDSVSHAFVCFQASPAAFKLASSSLV